MSTTFYWKIDPKSCIYPNGVRKSTVIYCMCTLLFFSELYWGRVQFDAVVDLIPYKLVVTYIVHVKQNLPQLKYVRFNIFWILEFYS